jgi:hypothetical protein
MGSYSQVAKVDSGATAIELQDALSESFVEQMGDSLQLFGHFMDDLCNDEDSFMEFAFLLQQFVTNDQEYLDHGLNFRDFCRKQMGRFAQVAAKARLG